jgi:thiosulfate reductase cytochrome b subunit
MIMRPWCHRAARYGGGVTAATIPRWFVILILIPGTLFAAAMAVLLARALREIPETASFFVTYPGDATPWAGTPVGFPAWLSWTHFLSGFFLLFILRSGLLIRARHRPPAFVTRRAAGASRLSLHTWWHLVVDTLWALTGVVYIVLLVVSGQWKRLIPASWDVIPNAVSALGQYVSLDWPSHHGWTQYNALQLLLYGFTVFVAGPVAVIVGLRLSPVWPTRLKRATGLLGDRFARTLHWLTAVYFIAFTVVHVGLVLTTGALANLNHMYAGRDDETWIGAGVFGVSLFVTIAAFVLLRPPAQTRIAELAGNDVRWMRQ